MSLLLRINASRTQTERDVVDHDVVGVTEDHAIAGDGDRGGGTGPVQSKLPTGDVELRCKNDLAPPP